VAPLGAKVRRQRSAVVLTLVTDAATNERLAMVLRPVLGTLEIRSSSFSWRWGRA